MRTRKEVKSFLHCGVGGMKCPCCGPAPGKDKKRALRAAKRRMRRADRKETQEDLES